MTVLRTAFVRGEIWKRFVEDDPGYRIGQFGDGTVVTIRPVEWPSDTGYGDFNENGWLRFDDGEIPA